MLRRAGHGHGAARQHQHNRQHGSHERKLLLFCNQGNAPPQLLLALRHGGGGVDQAARAGLAAQEGEQRFAVFQPLILAQQRNGAHVAGVLAVRTADGRGDPHHGIEPMHDQHDAAQHRPPEVALLFVGKLMRQDVPHAVRVVQHGGRDDDLGAQRVHQAGRGHCAGDKDLRFAEQPLFLRQQLHRPLRAADAPGELRIDQRDIRRGNGCPEQPDARQNL